MYRYVPIVGGIGGPLRDKFWADFGAKKLGQKNSDQIRTRSKALRVVWMILHSVSTCSIDQSSTGSNSRNSGIALVIRLGRTPGSEVWANVHWHSASRRRSRARFESCSSARIGVYSFAARDVWFANVSRKSAACCSPASWWTVSSATASVSPDKSRWTAVEAWRRELTWPRPGGWHRKMPCAPGSG